MTRALRRTMARASLVVSMATVLLASEALAQRRPQWFSAWTASHNVGEIVPALSNTTVRMIVRPTISGNALRIKLDNTRAQAPATFSGVFIGVSELGASVVPGTNTRLTFAGA